MTATRYLHSGVVLVRASTDPGGLDLPDGDLDSEHWQATGGKAWLARLWQRSEIVTALRVASPALARQIDTVLATATPETRVLRRVIVSTCTYLLRWRHRATPFGLFAGVAAACVLADDPAQTPTVWLGDKHRVFARADARWLGRLIDSLERDPTVLPHLRVVANNAAFARGDNWVIPARFGDHTPENDTNSAPLEVSLRNTWPVRAAVTGAATPITVHDLAARIRATQPSTPAEKIEGLLAELVTHGALLTDLRAPMTTPNGLAHLLTQLERLDPVELPDVAALLTDLTAIHHELSTHHTLTPHGTDLDEIAEHMRAIQFSGERHDDRVLAVDVALDCQIAIPDAVLREAQAAATTLARLTPHPHGSPAWKDFHSRFLTHYGAGALVAVRDVIADSGLGMPAGFLGAPHPQGVRAMTVRDENLLALIQRAAMDGSNEIDLTEQTIVELTGADGEQMIPPSRVELAFQLHARSPEAIASGDFELWVSGAPRAASSMAARFVPLLTEQNQRRLADTYAPNHPHTLAAQLSFPPRRTPNDNITRAPRLLPQVISLGEHRDPTQDGLIGLEDLAVTADAARMVLVRISTRTPVRAHVLHALEASVQTPPLARFLTEVGTAREAVYGAFDFGAARALTALPRVRHGRVVLAPARWLLHAIDLATPEQGAARWTSTLSAWRERWRVPQLVLLCQGEMRLPLDLDDPRHQSLLRTRLTRAGRVELRETGSTEGHGWSGRACEFLVPLTLDNTQAAVQSAAPGRALASRAIPVAPTGGQMPGHLTLVHARLSVDPARLDEILTRHQSHLLGAIPGLVRWWFTRIPDIRPGADLGLYLRLPSSEAYGPTAAVVADWAGGLVDLGLLADLSLGSYRAHTGRYGNAAAAAVENVFQADSAAALAQIKMAAHTTIPATALAAVSLVDLACGVSGTPELGRWWLTDLLPRTHGKLNRALCEATLALADTGSDHAALRAYPGGDAVADAWEHRREALVAYRDQLDDNHDPHTVLSSLLTDHLNRAIGPDPDHERLIHRLARAVALRQDALAARSAP